MIYEYENTIIPNFFKKAIPDLKLIAFSSQEEIFQMMAASVKYPSLYFYRSTDELVLSKLYKFSEQRFNSDGSFKNLKKREVYIAPLTYSAVLVVEKQKLALSLLTYLRTYWGNNSYVNLHWPTKDDSLSIELRLLYIKLSSVRGSDSHAGSQRNIEMSWKSNLLLNKDYENTGVNDFEIILDAADPKGIDNELIIKNK